MQQSIHHDQCHVHKQCGDWPTQACDARPRHEHLHLIVVTLDTAIAKQDKQIRAQDKSKKLKTTYRVQLIEACQIVALEPRITAERACIDRYRLHGPTHHRRSEQHAAHRQKHKAHARAAQGTGDRALSLIAVGVGRVAIPTAVIALCKQPAP